MYFTFSYYEWVKLLFIYLRPICISSSVTCHISCLYLPMELVFLSILFRKFIYHSYCKYFPQLNSLAFPTPRDLPSRGIEPHVAGRFLTILSYREALNSLEKWKLLCGVWLYVTPSTRWYMEFSRPEYWSGQPFPSPEDLPKPGIIQRIFPT